jgi:hypothetical protein
VCLESAQIDSYLNHSEDRESKSYQDIPPTTHNLVFRTHTDVREYVPHSGQEYSHVVALQTYVLHIGCAYGPTVACGGPDPRVGMKGKRLLRNDHWMFQACELGLPLQGYENSIQNRPFLALALIETAYSFCHIE